MSVVHAYRQSAIYGGICRSALGRYILRPPEQERDVLARSLTLRVPRTLAGSRWILSSGGAITIALAMIGGSSSSVALVAVFLLALHAPVLALGLTPALLLAGPKLPIAQVGDEMLFLRLDQAAIAGMVVACLVRRERPLRTPHCHNVLILFLGAIVASMITGVLQHTLTTPASAVLYLGQWITWYSLYVVAFNLAPHLGNRAVYAWALPLIALAAYGLAEYVWPYYENPGIRYRTFERGYFPGQANHAGGLFALATVTGVALMISSRHRLLGLVLAILPTLALVTTASRSGAVAWAAGLAALGLLYVPALRWWLPPGAVVGMAAVPTGIWYAWSAPGSSMYDRLVAWKSALSTVTDYPLLGLGAGARHRSFYDNQYFMTLAESGAVGLLLWLFFLMALTKALAHGRKESVAVRWMATGAVAALVVAATHGLATASFIVTLVAGPFFWLCGVTLGRVADRA